MAALTWRNVDAPDFRPSMEGYQTFSRLLDNAFGGLQQGLGRYDRSISDRVNTALQLRIAGAQDAQAAKAITSNLATDPNANRISAATIDMATARPNALISQALNQENLDNTVYRNDRVQGFDKAEDAAAPLVASRLAAYAAGKGAEWEAANPDAFKGLSMAARTSMFGQGQDAESKALSITGQGITNDGGRISNDQGRFGLETGRWNFDNQKVDRNEARAAQSFVSNYLATGHDGSDIDGALASSGLSGPAQLIARQLAGVGGGGSSGGGGSAPAGGAGAGAIGVMNYQARAAGFASVPESVQTLGQASDFAIQVNKAGVPSSAMGIYQIVGQTMRNVAPKVFGDSWRDQNFRDPAVQDKIAERIFNDNRGSADALRGQWVSLSPQQAEAVRKMPWSQARQYIAAGESGGNPAALMIGQTLATQGGKNQFMQGNANSIAEPIQNALTDTSSLVDVATKLTSGSLKGADRGWVMRQIQQIQAMGNGGRNAVQISPAAAAEILTRSVDTTGANWLPDRFNRDAIGGGLQINRDIAKSFVDQVRTGDFQRQVVTNQGIAQRNQMVQTAEGQWSQARANLQRAQQRAASNPNFDRAILGRLAIAENVAAEAYRNAIGVAGTSAQMAGGMGRSAAEVPAPVAAPPAPRPVATRRPNVAPASSRPLADTAPGWFARSANQKKARSDELMQYYLAPQQPSLLRR